MRGDGIHPSKWSLVDVDTGRRHPLRGHTALVGDVDVSPDGSLLASGGVDTTVRLWDVAERRELAVLQAVGGRY